MPVCHAAPQRQFYATPVEDGSPEFVAHGRRSPASRNAPAGHHHGWKPQRVQSREGAARRAATERLSNIPNPSIPPHRAAGATIAQTEPRMSSPKGCDW